ncbi:MAG: glycerol acyltransferase [Actinobacteria bacterium]|nr:MAG: glycerol acyltransferase [Actinomycetota bacterium]
MAQTGIADRAARNGHAADEGGAGLAGRLLGGLARQVQQRIPAADLDERDPDYIRESLPRQWLLASLWFRGEVRGLGNIPESGPVLLVGNHSGGNMTPDTIVFTLAFYTYFGVERPFYQLAHNLVVSFPQLSFLRKFGTVAASPENSAKALQAGAALLVYPGGDRRSLARGLGLDRLFRLKVLPISLALPWGINVGDFLGHIPLPAKITVEALPPIDLREEFGQQPDLDEVYDHVMRLMQDTLDALAAERRLPVLG